VDVIRSLLWPCLKSPKAALSFALGFSPVMSGTKRCVKPF
jgi:hypothetical protein